MQTLVNFYKSRGFICTNSLAYTFLLAFIPFLIATASISDLLPFSNQLVVEVQTYFFSRFLPQSGSQVYDLFKMSFSHSTRLSVLGILSLLITTYGMMFAVEQHIHQMWYLKRQRSILKTIIIFSCFLVCGPLLTYSVAYIYELLYIYFELAWVENAVSDFLSVIITVTSFIFVYKYIPNKKVKWRHASASGIIAGVLFSILRWLLAISMGNLQENYSLLYGSLATLPIFMLWIYLSCLIFLYCAQIIYVAEIKYDLKDKESD